MDIIIPFDLIKSDPKRLKEFLEKDSRYLNADPVTQLKYRVQLGKFGENCQN